MKLELKEDMSKFPTTNNIQKHLEESEELLREEDSISRYINNIRQLDELNLGFLNTYEDDDNLNRGDHISQIYYTLIHPLLSQRFFYY